jgi:general secretion pathway protein E
MSVVTSEIGKAVLSGLKGASPGRIVAPAGQISEADLAEHFGAFLTDENIITSLVLDRARRAARTTGERFDRVLTKLGLMSEAELAAALSRYLSIPLATAAAVPAEPIQPDMIPPDFVRRNRVMPLAVDAGTLSVGVTDPFNDEPLRALGYLTKLTVTTRIFVPADFGKAYEALYIDPAAEASADPAAGAEANEVDVQRLRDMASEAPTIRLVNQIIFSAVELRASDIHIEPNVDSVLVRYRIDGALRTAQTLAPNLRAAVTSRIKIMSRLDIAERRLPQDGRI